MNVCEDFPCCGHGNCRLETAGTLNKGKVKLYYFCACGTKVSAENKAKFGLICRRCRQKAYERAT
jgi:hypothetical protein